MKYSLQVSVLLCLIHLFDVQCFGTVTVNRPSKHNGDTDADQLRNNDDIIISAKRRGCGCHTHNFNSDSDSDSSSNVLKRDNEILIDNTKHFHEHKHNYLLIGLGSSKEDDHGSRCEHRRRNEQVVKQTVDKVQPPEDEDNEEEEEEEEYYDEPNSARRDETYSYDDPRRPIAKLVKANNNLLPTYETKQTSSKLNSERRGDLKQIKYQDIPDRTRVFEDDDGYLNGDLIDDRRTGALKKSKYITSRTGALNNDQDLNEDLVDDTPRGAIKQTRYRYTPDNTRDLENRRGVYDDLEYITPRNTDLLDKYDDLI